MPAFIPSLELNRRFYQEMVRPILDQAFPGLSYAAALIGPGSEILGFDTAMSMDHDWAARVFLILKPADGTLKEAIAERLSRQLPANFLGFPVHLADARFSSLRPATTGPVKHLVIPITLPDFMQIQLGYDLNQPLQATDWLTFRSSALGEFTAGAVYYDGVAELTRLREQFAWYPHDVWLYLLAASWQRIGQEEHLMPRAGSVGGRARFQPDRRSASSRYYVFVVFDGEAICPIFKMVWHGFSKIARCGQVSSGFVAGAASR